MATIEDLIKKLSRNSYAKNFPYKYEIVKEIPRGKLIKKYKNMLPYVGKPQYDVYNYKSFIKKVIKNAKYMYNCSVRDLEEAKKENDKETIEMEEESLKEMIKLIPNLNKIISKKVNEIYCIIEYPLDKKAIFKYKIEEEITIGKLLYIYSHMYHEIYRIEDENMDNPVFGIWGHYIGDLVYNGHNTIKVYENYIVCKFECDS